MYDNKTDKMDIIDLFLKRYSYKFPKGYIDIDDQNDRIILESIFNNLGLEINLNEQEIRTVSRDKVPGRKASNQKASEEEIKQDIEDATSKEDLIKIIQDLNLSSDQLSRLKKLIFNLNTTDELDDFLNKIVAEKNIPASEVTKFGNLIKEKGLETEFVEYFKNPADLDLNASNFTSLIPNIDKKELLDLYRSMGSAIVQTVSIGPGEIPFIIWFKNVKKRDSKGDLDVDGKNVELKASTKGAGAVVAKGYNRGEWKTTKRKGRFEEVIEGLGWSDEELKNDALKKLDESLNWASKISDIYDLYFQDDSFNQSEFIEAVKNILDNIYTKSDWQNGGKYFKLESYFNNNDMDSNRFRVDLAKELVNEYREAEGFDGILYVDKNGNLKYLQEEEIIDKIGKEIKVSGPSDDVPRLVYKT
jgi:hypothetical protein